MEFECSNTLIHEKNCIKEINFHCNLEKNWVQDELLHSKSVNPFLSGIWTLMKLLTQPSVEPTIELHDSVWEIAEWRYVFTQP